MIGSVVAVIISGALAALIGLAAVVGKRRT
jgi:ABC-type uncharacterized transport system permease subunit